MIIWTLFTRAILHYLCFLSTFWKFTFVTQNIQIWRRTWFTLVVWHYYLTFSTFLYAHITLIIRLLISRAIFTITGTFNLINCAKLGNTFTCYKIRFKAIFTSSIILHYLLETILLLTSMMIYTFSSVIWWDFISVAFFARPIFLKNLMFSTFIWTTTHSIILSFLIWRTVLAFSVT